MYRQTLAVLLIQVVPVILGFNLETNNPWVFLQNPKSYFGYKVCHFGSKHSNSVLITSPLREDGTGGVYKCPYRGQCELLPIKVNPGISFGMSLACTADQAMVCGPRLTQQCNHLSYLNGLCVEIGPGFIENTKIKPGFQECRNISLDAVILFDSSQSILESDFKTMINFIKAIIHMFKDPGTQVAVAQYATDYHAVFNFENFAASSRPIDLMNDVIHKKGNTYTAAAIRFVLENMFTEDKGMQKDSKKLLVVITDGKSNDPSETLDAVLPLAQAMNVSMYAIGVGKELSHEELLKIALNNSKNVMRADSFDALSSIQNVLRSKIFAIEGTGVVSNHSSFEKELSQGGFSIAMSEHESVFGAVGAYTWSGGLEKYGVGLGATFINASAEARDLRDSYLGYSVTILTVNQERVYFAGAPRYNHTGLVLGFQQSQGNGTWTMSYRIAGTQFGSYFGSALCTLTGKSYGKNGVLVIGAPFFHGKGIGGEVRICEMEYEVPNCTERLHGASGNNLGQFGASLSSCPDLNGDGAPELAVGAPFENKGKGSLYIFLSHGKGLMTVYSQRITGSQLDSRLQYFGLSVHSAGDLSSDGLTDLVVGGRGSATIIRSHPVMCLSVSITLDPPVIPQDLFHCSNPRGINSLVSAVHLCTTLKEVVKGSIQTPFQAVVSMTLELDQEKSPPRLKFFSTPHWNMSLAGSQTFCQKLHLTLPGCISDYHEPLLSGKLTADVEDIPGSHGLRPMHSPDCPLSFLSKVSLEKVCGEDHVCVSDLSVSVSFQSSVVVNFTGFPVDVLVEVVNNAEDASAITLQLFFPSLLSFSQAFTQQTVEKKPLQCGLDSSVTGPYSLINCELGSAVIRQKAMKKVQISLTVFDPTSLSDTLSVNVSVMCKSEKVQTLRDNSAQATVPVKMPFNVIVLDGDSTRYVSFPEKTQLHHEFKVENIGEAAVPVNATFVLPVELDSGFLWAVTLTDRKGQNKKCFEKKVTDKEDKRCKTDACSLFECTINSLATKQQISFIFFGVISRNVQGSGVQVNLESWAFLSFDDAHYTQFPINEGLSHSIVSELEVPSQRPASIIATVSVLCTLIILLIISGILYKVGFFKSNKKDNEDKAVSSVQEDEGTSPPADQPPDTAETSGTAS